MLSLVCSLASCHWHEVKEVIALADSLDQTEHVIYDDTAALGMVIRSLDNPFGRLFMPNTLGKAYYYMGRNLEDRYMQVSDAAKCYISADRLQIDDPIYRGRINSCMGYICAQNNNDSIALIFYERASKEFKQSNNNWMYAQCVLNIVKRKIELQQYDVADSMLYIVKSYQSDSAYQARWYETRGLSFYAQLQYDSALVYFQRGLEYWQNENEKSFGYLKIMQVYFDKKQLDSTIYYANPIVSISTNPNYLSNAYYCLMQNAENEENTELVSTYASMREDMNRILETRKEPYTQAVITLEEYLQNPHPWRWVWIALTSILITCISLAVGIIVYHQRAYVAYQQIDQLSTHIESQEVLLSHELYYRQFSEKLSNIIDRYHTPHKRWKEYKILKRDLSPWLHLWLHQLDTLPLSDREKVYCTISLVYAHMTDTEIAEYLCYGKHGIRTFKQRIAQKLGTTSAYFPDFLRNLPVNQIPPFS